MAKEYKINDLISSEELYHHGIKGQKWGGLTAMELDLRNKR